MKKADIVVIALAFLIVAGGLIYAFSGGGESTKPGESKESQKKESFEAPRFALEDYDGNEVTSKDFRGKIFVVNTWATWCPFCLNELPDFKLLQETFPDDVAVIAVNRAEPIHVAKGYSDENDLTDHLIFLVDPQDSFYKSIGGFSMPETLFISSKGKILQHKRGPLTFEEMKAVIEKHL